MTTTIQNVTFFEIKDVCKSGDEEGVYFANILFSAAQGFPAEWNFYCARADDYAPTGKWVYQQIIDGNFEGQITQLAPNVDPMTGEPWAQPIQPTNQGAQTL